jgi:hypothetical protein
MAGIIAKLVLTRDYRIVWYIALDSIEVIIIYKAISITNFTKLIGSRNSVYLTDKADSIILILNSPYS